jgi:uncharacterized protein (UPF0332 family)
MMFDWGDFLQLARSLGTDPGTPGPEEAALRSSASRAYYAAFGLALRRAKSEGFMPTYSGLDHAEVRRHFRNPGPNDKVRRHISAELERLLDLRQKSDYEDNLRTPAPSLAQRAILMAESIISDVTSL